MTKDQKSEAQGYKAALNNLPPSCPKGCIKSIYMKWYALGKKRVESALKGAK